MSRWEIAFRVALVALLATIALQLGAWESVLDLAHEAASSVRTIGKPSEEPADGSSGGLGLLYQKDTDAALDAMAAMPAASGASR